MLHSLNKSTSASKKGVPICSEMLVCGSKGGTLSVSKALFEHIAACHKSFWIEKIAN